MPKFYCKVIPAASPAPAVLSCVKHFVVFVSLSLSFQLRQFAQHAISDFYKSSPSSTISDFNASQYQDASKPR